MYCWNVESREISTINIREIPQNIHEKVIIFLRLKHRQFIDERKEKFKLFTRKEKKLQTLCKAKENIFNIDFLIWNRLTVSMFTRRKHDWNNSEKYTRNNRKHINSRAKKSFCRKLKLFNVFNRVFY